MTWTLEDMEFLGRANDDIYQLERLQTALNNLNDGLYASTVRDDGQLTDRVEELIEATKKLIDILEKKKLEEYNKQFPN